MPEIRVQLMDGTDINELIAWSQRNYTEAQWREVRATSKAFEITTAIEVERKRLQISKKELGDATGLTKTQISALEMCDYFPEFDKVLRVIEELGLEITISKKDGSLIDV